jgi:hypothetical protein
MSSDNDYFVYAHDLWTRIKSKYFKSICIASAPFVAYGTNLSKGEEQERCQPNDESTSPTGSSLTSYKCLVANNDSGDESDDEEELDDSEDESTSSQGTFSRIALTNNDDREKETDDVGEEEIRQFYTNLSKEDKILLITLLGKEELSRAQLAFNELLLRIFNPRGFGFLVHLLVYSQQYKQTI